MELDVDRTIRLEVRNSQRGCTQPSEPVGQRYERLLLRLDDGREAVVDEKVMIGCAEDNDLVLADPYVSGWHCVVRREGNRVIVVDCGSKNGTFVGGTRVECGELTPGMRITVGRTAIRVATEGVTARPGAGMVGSSLAIERVRSQIARVAPTRATVLILGESGTGKELAALALHEQSGRSGAFVVVNCGAISPSLVESELFGHERGAFTGAAGRRRGVFEEADGGTLFLDEIGELPLELQPKLLRALEQGTVRAIGGSGERKIDVRVIAATHRDLPGEVREGRFRLDLFHRLSMVSLQLPSLRQRRADIAELAEHFLDQIAPETGGRKFLSSSAREAIVAHGWPGNVRELRNAIHRAAIFGGGMLEAEDLLPAPSPKSGESGRIQIDGRRLEDVEREVISVALRRSGGNRRAAAQSLGVPKSTLCDKVRRYRLEVAE
jgi:DNA-binding NtrC family response regulator